MASTLAILDLKGKSLIKREYRGDVDPECLERFVPLLSEQEDEGVVPPPCFQDPDTGVNFIHVRHANLFFVAVTKRNIFAAELLVFMHKLIGIFTEYFKNVEEESVRDNFVTVYELLDEVMDHGVPQSTDPGILKEYIMQESYKLDKPTKPPMAVTNAVSWRSEGIVYKKNEVWLDVIESLNVLVNANGKVIRSEVIGKINLNARLSGMPEIRLGINDRLMLEAAGRSTSSRKTIEMEDVRFHQCVRLSRFESDRTISCIPPDGESQLLTYRISSDIKPLIWVESQIEKHSSTRVEYVVKVKSNYKKKSRANWVEITIPVSEDAISPRFRAASGDVRYYPERDCMTWRIKNMYGGSELFLRADFSLPSVQSEEPEQPRPITVKFEIPYYTVSGLQLRYLKVIAREGYSALPWVRYIAEAGDEYALRTNAPLRPPKKGGS